MKEILYKVALTAHQMPPYEVYVVATDYADAHNKAVASWPYGDTTDARVIAVVYIGTGNEAVDGVFEYCVK